MKTKILLITLTATMLLGCDANMATLKSLGSDHIVTLYAADGKIIQTWIAVGSIQTDQGGQLYFMEKDSRLPIYVYGTYVVSIKQ